MYKLHQSATYTRKRKKTYGSRYPQHSSGIDIPIQNKQNNETTTQKIRKKKQLQNKNVTLKHFLLSDIQNVIHHSLKKKQAKNVSHFLRTFHS